MLNQIAYGEKLNLAHELFSGRSANMSTSFCLLISASIKRMIKCGVPSLSYGMVVMAQVPEVVISPEMSDGAGGVVVCKGHRH